MKFIIYPTVKSKLQTNSVQYNQIDDKWLFFVGHMSLSMSF